MLQIPEVGDNIQQFEVQIEELRTICRVHAFPTGSWENLMELPLRLSQDAGFRSDFVEVIHSLQARRLHLPEVLDILVVAVGGTAAPRHTRQLSEYLNVLGGFLSSIGRWPDTAFEPVLAPGEIPANLHKFMRPPGPSTYSERDTPQAISPDPDPPGRGSPESHASEPVSTGTPWPQAPHPEPPAQTRRRYEAFEPDPIAHEATLVSRDNQAPPPEPPPARRADPTPGPAPQRAASRPSIQAPRAGVDELSAAVLPLADITHALARLERGNLELRAHLDSIDQRISRMEPLLESGSAPQPTSPTLVPRDSDPEFRPRPEPLRSPASEFRRERPASGPAPLPPNPIPSARAHYQAAQSRLEHVKPIRPDLLRPEHLHGDHVASQAHGDSDRQDQLRPEPPRKSSRAENSGAETRRETRSVAPRPAEPNPERMFDSPPLPLPPKKPGRFVPDLRDGDPTAFEERSDSFSFDQTRRASSNPVTSPSAVVSRFSRFSRTSESIPDIADTETPGQSFDRSELSDPDRPGRALGEPGTLKPNRLPRGFFGTAAEDPADLEDQTPQLRGRESGDPHTEPGSAFEPVAPVLTEVYGSPRRERRFGLIITVLILLGLLCAAAFLYFRGVARDPNPDPTSAISPRPAPRQTSAPHAATEGPLTTTPSRPAESQHSGSSSAKVLGARDAFQPRQSSEDLGSSDGFRPAGTFVPSSVMDAHLVAAPIPDKPRVPPSAGSKAIVVMEVNISNTGQVEDIHVLGGSAALRFAAIDAVRNWRYKPYLVNGTPVEIRTLVRVDFTEHRSEPAVRSAPFPS